MKVRFKAVFAVSMTSVLFMASLPSHAQRFMMPIGATKIVGAVQVTNSLPEDTLTKIATRYELGFNEIVQANPTLSQTKVLAKNTAVVLPTQYILPNAPYQGIVVNVAEMRLYYYPKPLEGQQAVVYTFPVAVGKVNSQTPTGITTVVEKIKNPTWTPPASIRNENAKQGIKLPKVVPAGPNNPLGQRALRLGLPNYLIHGTNQPDSIGKNQSHGCIRMRAKDIETLFDLVNKDELVSLIYQPVKVTSSENQVIAEFHTPNPKRPFSQAQAIQLIKSFAIQSQYVKPLSEFEIQQAYTQMSGIPVLFK